jgi:hypothetical protein
MPSRIATRTRYISLGPRQVTGRSPTSLRRFLTYAVWGRVPLLAGSALVGLTGCASMSSPWIAFPGQEELVSFDARVKARKETPDLSALKPELLAYWDGLYAAALTRSKLEWEAAGMATYGGLISVVGGLASKIALVNTGAAVAAVGLINSSFYRFPQQTQVYLTALKRISCILGKVNVVDDMLLVRAARSSDADAVITAASFVQTVISSVDFVRVEYTGALLGLTPSIPSKDEILAGYARYRPVAAGAPFAAGTPADPNQPLYDQAGETVRTLAADIQACSKL